MTLLQPKDITITSVDFPEGKEFVISKFNSRAWRRIVPKYLEYNTPWLPIPNKFNLSEEACLDLMHFVGVKTPNGILPLTTWELIDCHTNGGETLVQIEREVMKYNCSFFRKDAVSNSLEGFAEKVKSWTTSTLTDSLQQLFKATSPPSES